MLDIYMYVKCETSQWHKDNVNNDVKIREKKVI